MTENISETNLEQKEPEEQSPRFSIIRGFLKGILFGATIISVALILAAVVVPRFIGAIPLTVLTGSMVPKFNPGDLIITMPVDGNEVKTGDIITFQPESANPLLITHRVVSTGFTVSGEKVIVTKGDANDANDPSIIPDQVMGKYIYHIPYLGWVANAIPSSNKPVVMIYLGIGLFAYAGLVLIYSLISKAIGRRKEKKESSPAPTSEERIAAARGNAVPGGTISSLGATGASAVLVESKKDDKLKSDGRPSWVGRSKYGQTSD